MGLTCVQLGCNRWSSWSRWSRWSRRSRWSMWSRSSSRQVLRLTQKVRRENEPPESAQLNFGAIFHGKFSLWLPCWAHIWILQHINSVFLMRNRSHIQNSQRNHLPSLFFQFGTLSIKWISHIRWMDLSYSGVLFPHNSTLQLCQVDLKWSCTWKCNLLGYLSSQRHFFTLNLVFHGCFCSNYWALPSNIFINIWWTRLC